MRPGGGDDAFPTEADVARAFDDLADFATALTGDDADVTLGTRGTDHVFLEIVPRRAGARPVSLAADQWIVLEMGAPGGRWELDCSEEGIDFARKAITAAVHGAVEERSAWGRSMVTLSFADGSRHSETGYAGCLTLLVPLPGWRRWGALTRSAPYAA